MDFASRYHRRLFGHSVDDYIFEPRKSLTALPEPFRDLVRGADRQALVDFVNTLEDISCNVDCEELWNADPSFWSWYTHGNLIRLMLYRDEIGIDTGIELEESNWKPSPGAGRVACLWKYKRRSCPPYDKQFGGHHQCPESGASPRARGT